MAVLRSLKSQEHVVFHCPNLLRHFLAILFIRYITRGIRYPKDSKKFFRADL